MANTKRIGDRFVFGPFGDIGYVAKKAGHGATTLKKFEMLSERDREDGKIEIELNRMKEEEIKKNFWMFSDLRLLNAKIKRMVELGMKAHDEGLNDKRNHLKVMMLKEQSDLTEEYTDKAQKTADVEYEEKKKRAADIESRAADLQESLVKNAYERIFKDNCDELRTVIQRQNRKALNQIHQMQIQEKCLAEKWEKEEEELWNEMEIASYDRTAQRSIQEATDVFKKHENYVLALEQQRKASEKARKNADCVERWEESYREDIQKLKEHELVVRDEEVKRRREIYNRDLRQQLEVDRLIKERRKEEDKSVGKLLIEEDIKAAQKEKDAILDSREQQRKELITFKESLEQYRTEVSKAEELMDANTAQQIKEIENKRMAERYQAVKARRNLLSSCVEHQRLTASQKAALKTQISNDTIEAEFNRFKISENLEPDVNKIRANATRLVDLDAHKANEECEKYNKIILRRELMTDQENLEKLRKKGEETEKRIDEVLKRPLQFTHGNGVHPFVNLLMPPK